MNQCRAQLFSFFRHHARCFSVRTHAGIDVGFSFIDGRVRRRIHDQRGLHIPHNLSHLVEVTKIKPAAIQRNDTPQSLQASLEFKADLAVHASQQDRCLFTRSHSTTLTRNDRLPPTAYLPHPSPLATARNRSANQSRSPDRSTRCCAHAPGTSNRWSYTETALTPTTRRIHAQSPVAPTVADGSLPTDSHPPTYRSSASFYGYRRRHRIPRLQP